MEKILQICLIEGYRGLRVTGQLLNSNSFVYFVEKKEKKLWKRLPCKGFVTYV